MSLLCLFGALQGVLLAIAIGSFGGGLPRANRLLSAILLGASTVVAAILMSHRRGVGAAPTGAWFDFELVEYSLWFFAGPAALFYVTLVVARDRWPRSRFALHFAPGALWLVYAGSSSVFLQSSPRLPPVLWMMLYQMAYTLAAFIGWRRDQPGTEPSARSAALGIHGIWVPALLVVLIIQHAAQFVRWAFPDEAVLTDIVPLTGAASFVVVTLFGLRKALPFLGSSRRRYASSTLTPKRAREVAGQLEKMMENERLYLEPELTLETVASALGVPKTYLSQVLNDTLGKSFLDYLAAYRVRESVRLLTDEDARHLTIEGVARRSGFRSRSAFYEAFRRHQGGTPTQFRKQAAAN